MDGYMDRLIYGQMDRLIDGQMDRWIDGQMDRWIDGQMDRQIDVIPRYTLYKLLLTPVKKLYAFSNTVKYINKLDLNRQIDVWIDE